MFKYLTYHVEWSQSVNLQILSPVTCCDMKITFFLLLFCLQGTS